MKSSFFSFSCIAIALVLLAPASGQQIAPRAAELHVFLPDESARLTVDGTLTKQRGAERRFHSPPLEPGHTYVYTITATWDTNNYTKVIRSRTVKFQAGQHVKVDLRKADLADPDKYHIRFVPTPEDVVEAMCKLGMVGKDDVVYDLGCGDGRIVITAVKEFGAKRGVGVDLDANLVKTSRQNAKGSGVADKVEFRKADVLELKDLSDASVVMLYMGEDVNLRLRPILKESLKPGARIVSHDFTMGDWKADKSVSIVADDGEEHIVYLWKIGK